MLRLTRTLLVIAGGLFLTACATAPRSLATSLGGPLTLADEGTFFVNGTTVVSKHPGASPAGPAIPGTVTVNQMYVHYRIPAQRVSPTPIVLVHGGGLTGTSYETTPDGREAGRPRHEGRKAVVGRINQQEGGKATLVRLPEVGLKGNSHMLMQDRNNLQVADLLLGWIEMHVK